MAIENGHIHAINNLALYYYETAQDYEKAKKYYLMAIDKGDSTAMFNLATYYETIEEDYEQAQKYYSMATDNGYIDVTNM
jgi:tetratricopeptide (TPR) repeat protein